VGLSPQVSPDVLSARVRREQVLGAPSFAGIGLLIAVATLAGGQATVHQPMGKALGSGHGPRHLPGHLYSGTVTSRSVGG
jgi:hypothetical protein